MLFEHQSALDRDSLLSYARSRRHSSAPRSSPASTATRRAAPSQRDVAAGTRLKIESTPTLYFNGRTVRRRAEPAQSSTTRSELERAQSRPSARS